MGEEKKKKGRTPSDDPKDRVLQARVPKALYNDLVAQARRLRVPVSNLVRNILEDSFRMVGNLVEGGLDIAEALAGKIGADDLAAVIGWQEIAVNRNLVCSRCAAALSKGAKAHAAVGGVHGRQVVICSKCKEELQ